MINKLYHWTIFYKIWPHDPDQFNLQIIPVLFFNTSVNSYPAIFTQWRRFKNWTLCWQTERCLWSCRSHSKSCKDNALSFPSKLHTIWHLKKVQPVFCYSFSHVFKACKHSTFKKKIKAFGNTSYHMQSSCPTRKENKLKLKYIQ